MRHKEKERKRQRRRERKRKSWTHAMHGQHNLQLNEFRAMCNTNTTSLVSSTFKFNAKINYFDFQACSYHCHPSHEIVELYTKRHFRCDCGNRKLKHNACKLANDKTPVNESNRYLVHLGEFDHMYCMLKESVVSHRQLLSGFARFIYLLQIHSNYLFSYNQNFKGVYCTCHRPYPDPEDETPDQMIQCIICEDWYHGRHLQVQNIDLDQWISTF